MRDDDNKKGLEDEIIGNELSGKDEEAFDWGNDANNFCCEDSGDCCDEVERADDNVVMS